MKYKEGDTVRIRSKEWIDAQDKNSYGSIDNDGFVMNRGMQDYGGRIVAIEAAREDNTYRLVGLDYVWQDWMFDPDYRPEDEPLSAKDAILAMVDGGETLYDEDGSAYWFSEADACFSTDSDSGKTPEDINYFYGLYRRPAKRKRPMTRWEILAWVNSEDSLGWVARGKYIGDGVLWGSWELPQCYRYDTCEGLLDKGVYEYQRARLLPDLSGIDESTIQGFEVEE